MNTADHFADLPAPTDEAVRAFQDNLPRLLVFVAERCRLKSRYSPAGTPGRTAEDRMDVFNARLGDLLSAVFEFDLAPILPGEFARHARQVQGSGTAPEHILDAVGSWVMAVRSSLSRTVADQLCPLLELLQRHAIALLQPERAAEPALDGDARTFLDYLLQRNRKFAAESLLSCMRRGMSVKDAYTGVLLPALEAVDLLLLQRKICIADIRIAEDICRYVMFRVIDSIFGERKYPFKVIVACMPGETHTLTGEVFANYLEIRGWTVFFVKNTESTDEILHAVAMTAPQALVVSVASPESLPAARHLLAQARELDPPVHRFAEGRAAALAAPLLGTAVSAILSGFERGHEQMLAEVMPHA